MSESLFDTNMLELLRGSIDTDRAAYRRERFAQMLRGEPTWIARGDSSKSDVYNYYRDSERVAYLEADSDGTVSACEVIESEVYPLPLPRNISLIEAAIFLEELHNSDESTN